MEFRSRFVRGLPVIALMASLLVPFKPVAAAEGPYTAAPGVSAAPTAQISAGDPAPADELDADARLKRRRHTKDLLTVASDEVDAAGRIKRHRRTRDLLTVAATDELDEAGRIKRHRRTKDLLTVAATDELDAAGKLRHRGHGRKPLLTVVSDEANAMKGRHKPRRV